MVTAVAEGRLSRISKFFLDRDDITPSEALLRRRSGDVRLACGGDVAESRTLQVALLTSASLAARCFPDAVRVECDAMLAASPLLLWPSLELTIGDALTGILGEDCFAGPRSEHGRTLVFGNAAAASGALRVTFDGWVGATGPADLLDRLPERGFFALSGVVAGALGVSEIFMSVADITVEACRRNVGLSLWQPDLGFTTATALGPPVQFLPKELWVLGLGHLGNAHLWALAALPYARPKDVKVFLNDFDRIEPENTETGILFARENVGLLKTRVCSAWLEARGFETRLVERRFDDTFRRRGDEPGLAFCGFDSNRARRALETAQFDRVVESGLGGTSDNFEVISLHTLPNQRPAAELWPDPSPEDVGVEDRRRGRIARESSAYAGLADECGRFALAGKSVAVPFVGAVAGSLAIAEALRVLHGGPAYTDLKIRLSTPTDLAARSQRTYSPVDCASLPYTLAT